LRDAAVSRDTAALREGFEEKPRLAATTEGRALAALPQEERERRLRGALTRLHPQGEASPLPSEQAAAAEREVQLLRAVTPPRDDFDGDDGAFRVYAALPAALREA